MATTANSSNALSAPECEVLQCGELRAEFSRAGDRFSHVVSVLDDEQWIPLFASIEGTPDDAWPVSPPWQEITREALSIGQPSLLLVGMAGKSHWSMCVLSELAGDCLRFDVACRVRTPPGPLASTYRLLAPAPQHSGGVNV